MQLCDFIKSIKHFYMSNLISMIVKDNCELSWQLSITDMELNRSVLFTNYEEHMISNSDTTAQWEGAACVHPECRTWVEGERSQWTWGWQRTVTTDTEVRWQKEWWDLTSQSLISDSGKSVALPPIHNLITTSKYSVLMSVAWSK